MAKIVEKVKLDLNVQFTITEEEARALDAITCYGVDNFIKALYEKLGKAYMEKHEKGLRLFLESVKDEIPIILARMNMALKNFNSAKNEKQTVKLGDIVSAVPPFVLGHGHTCAICISVDPFILISRDSPIVWNTTVKQSDVKSVAKATTEELVEAMERYKRECNIPTL